MDFSMKGLYFITIEFIEWFGFLAQHRQELRWVKFSRSLATSAYNDCC